MKLPDQVQLLPNQFNHTLQEMEYGDDHLFITGKAGTGKSTLLRLFKSTSKKRIAVLAPTGIAALNVQGQTLHSFFRFPPKMLDPSEIRKTKAHRFYKKVDVIIIDEISMVRADMMDNIDLFLKRNREVDLPFGGVKMIFFGDLFQLPPIVSSNFEKEYLTKNYGSPYFFNAKVMSHIELVTIELTQVHRQTDLSFIRLLDNIRTMHFDYDDLDTLNRRYEPEVYFDDFFITISPRNATVNAINQSNLKALGTPIESFIGTVSGNFNSNLCPAPVKLDLKVGAQVMFVKNDIDKRFVNGTIGKVIYTANDHIEVQIEKDGEKQNIEVMQSEWEMMKYKYNKAEEKIESEIVGTFEQYPLKLAWAITIHKSQGQTFDRVMIDMTGGAFEFGQTYVALSRCRSLEGIVLKKPLQPKDVKVDQRIVEFYEMIR